MSTIKKQAPIKVLGKIKTYRPFQTVVKAVKKKLQKKSLQS